MRPVIGITAYREPVTRAGEEVDAAVLPATYAEAVRRAGGVPLVVPPLAAHAGETLGAIDGLLLTGGGDVDPSRYGATAGDRVAEVRPLRDEAELQLLRQAMDDGLPVLGICRGHQLINVVCGGDLHQHLPDVVENDRHKRVPGVFVEHSVAIDGATRLGSLLGFRTTVKSHHHQAVRTLAPGLVASARASDGTVEALEADDGRFLLGVQWHPEEHDDHDELFRALVDAAARHAEEVRDAEQH